jgi:hypothetical protein
VIHRESRNLRAALGFLELPPRAPELRLLHRWLDAWMGVGLICVGVELLGYRLSLSHIAEAEWRAQFSAHRIRCGRGRLDVGTDAVAGGAAGGVGALTERRAGRACYSAASAGRGCLVR